MMSARQPSRAGRTRKYTEKMEGMLRTLDEGEAARARRKLAAELMDVSQKTQSPTVDKEEVQKGYERATAAHARLLELEDAETAELTLEEVKEYEDYYDTENQAIWDSNQTIKRFFTNEEVKPGDSASQIGAGDVQALEEQGYIPPQGSEKLLDQMTLQVEIESKKEQISKQAELDNELMKIEVMRKKLKREQELLELDTKLKISKAKVDLLESLERERKLLRHGSRGSTVSGTSSIVSRRTTPRPQAPSVKTAATPKFESTRQHVSTDSDGLLESRLEQGFSRLAEALTSSQRQSVKIEPDIFDGDVLQFKNWQQTFEELIENEVKEERRMIYLRKYTKGIPKEIVSALDHLDAIEGYRQAMQELERQYGNHFQVYEAYRRKLEAWPAVKEGDAVALKKFANFLSSCRATMDSVGQLRILDDVVENTKLVLKLPRHMGKSWGGKVDDWQASKGSGRQYEYPPFSKFVEFIQRQARIESGPILTALNRRTEAPKPKPLKTYHTEAEEIEEATCNHTAVGNRQGSGLECIKCKNKHELRDCKEIQSMTIGERHFLARSNELCKCCLKKGHYARECPSGLRCQKCKGRHDMIFHDDNFKPRMRKRNPDSGNRKETATAHLTNTEGKDATLIMPLLLTNTVNKLSCELYAILDLQSDASFMMPEVAEMLRAEAVNVELDLRTMSGSENVTAKKITRMEVRSLDGKFRHELGRAYVKEDISASYEQIATKAEAERWQHLRGIASKLHPVDRKRKISMLIGRSCLAAIKSEHTIPGTGNQPYATLTGLGWGVVGQMGSEVESDERAAWTYTTCAHEVSPSKVLQMFAIDFHNEDEETKMSAEDRKFVQCMEENVRTDLEGHVVLPLPFKNDGPLPNNRGQILKTLPRLKRKLEKDDTFKQHYKTFMDNLLSKGHAKRVTGPGTEGKVFYIMHQGVYHPFKPGKVRVVFHISLPYRGVSLNAVLLAGPDQINNLIGVLCRFRLEKIAMTCDIEAMFYQVRVTEEHQDYLRFFWWPDLDFSKEPEEFCMTVHPFGATSSPGVCNYALNYVADQHEEQFGTEAAEFVRKGFYVDDGLGNKPTVPRAISLIDNSRGLCAAGGFNLGKFTSNSKEVIAHIPEEARATELQVLDVKNTELPPERSLGQLWKPEKDVFTFRVELKTKPYTRRGVLSTIGSVYDPLGLACPFILLGKIILQEACQFVKDWDEPLSDTLMTRWKEWIEQVKALEEYEIPRWISTAKMGPDTTFDIHHFSDASLQGYGQCSYVRVTDTEGRVHVSLLLAKAKVTPNKPVTIPRLELAAAVISVKMANFTKKQMPFKDVQHHFYTDSKVVLGYISNPAKRFHIFVANRVQRIHEASDPKQWHYVRTDENPADLASRGVPVEELKESRLWKSGPQFLWDLQQTESHNTQLIEGDPEVRVTVLKTTAKETGIIWGHRLARFSTWRSVLRGVALIISRIRAAKEKTRVEVKLADRESATAALISASQRMHFHQDMSRLEEMRAGERVKVVMQSSKLCRLNPYVDEGNILRLGGRMEEADLSMEIRHPAILDNTSYLAKLLTEHHHRQSGHGGRESTLHSLRDYGLWILNPRRLIDRCVRDCVPCKRLKAGPARQKMSELPWDRVSPSPPFTQVGMDFFGPFHIKRARSTVKKHVAMFVCLVSGAVHLESAGGLSTDDFMNAYTRFVSRRGAVQLLRCDCGTNFIGSMRFLTEEKPDLDLDAIRRKLSQRECETVIFKLNTPRASHAGGVWERKIRTARSILNHVFLEHGSQLDEDLLVTSLAETEAVMNNRPLAVVDNSEHKPLTPISAATLLTMKPKTRPPPIRETDRKDVYAQKRWKRVQFIADEFWRRWRKELVPKIQTRQKWRTQERNLTPGDVVIEIDDAKHRYDWPLAVVTDVKVSKDGLVRTVTIRNKAGSYERPIQKLVPIVNRESDD